MQFVNKMAGFHKILGRGISFFFFFFCKIVFLASSIFYLNVGAQWLSGRVLDSRPKGRGFEPHRRHCVVVLEQDTFILA